MTTNNSEFNFPSDDWNGQSSYIWSECEGRKYLLKVTNYIQKFYEFYIKSRHISNRIDFIFMNMKWLYSAAQTNNLGDVEFAYNDSSSNVHTFHSTPLNVASSAIFAFIENVFDLITNQECADIPQRTCFDMLRLINKVSIEQQSGIYSIDSGDYALATCHFKNVIAKVNSTLAILNSLKVEAKDTNKVVLDFVSDISAAMFDIRELAWQAISFCYSVAE